MLLLSCRFGIFGRGLEQEADLCFVKLGILRLNVKSQYRRAHFSSNRHLYLLLKRSWPREKARADYSILFCAKKRAGATIPVLRTGFPQRSCCCSRSMDSRPSQLTFYPSSGSNYLHASRELY